MIVELRYFIIGILFTATIAVGLIGCTDSNLQAGTNVYYPTPCPAYNDHLRSIPENDEEYAVYTAFLSSRQFNQRTMVIYDTTISGSMENVEWIKSNTSVSDEAINDYSINEANNRKLENYFNVCGKVVIIDKQKIERFAEPNENWSKYRQEFPQAAHLIAFSRVGFNKDRTQALMGVNLISVEDADYRPVFWVFEKQDNKWKLGGATGTFFNVKGIK